MSENFTNASWIFKLNISRHARTGLLTHGSFIHSQMIPDIITNNSNVLIEINKAKFEGKEIAKSQHLDTLSNSSCYWAVISVGGGGGRGWMSNFSPLSCQEIGFCSSSDLSNLTTLPQGMHEDCWIGISYCTRLIWRLQWKLLEKLCCEWVHHQWWNVWVI